MPLDLSQFRQIFFEETAEHVANMEALLQNLDPRDPDPELLDDLGRAAHSIRGACATFGLRDMADMAQETGALVERARRRGGPLSAQTLGALREACAALRALLAACRAEDAAGQKVSPGGTAQDAGEVMALIEAAGAGGLGEVTAAVRRLGEAIERNAALARQAADEAEALGESLRVLVRAIAMQALAPPARATARPRALPKVRRASAATGGDKEWPES